MIFERLRAFARKIKDLFNLPEILGVRLSAIDDALVELDAGVAEVAREMGELADKVEAGDLSIAEVAGEIRNRAATLRGIRPDEVPVPGDDGSVSE